MQRTSFDIMLAVDPSFPLGCPTNHNRSLDRRRRGCSEAKCQDDALPAGLQERASWQLAMCLSRDYSFRNKTVSHLNCDPVKLFHQTPVPTDAILTSFHLPEHISHVEALAFILH
jgi:hypothetical protein